MSQPSILDIGYTYTEEKLWSLDVPVENILTTELENNLDIPYLDHEGTDEWNMTPRELLKNLEIEVSHSQKMQSAELAYPIEIYFHKNEWIILDGVHRFAKAIHAGKDTIAVRKITDELLTAIQ